MQNKYISIYDDLVKKIKQNIWPIDSLLPSENELTTHYETSRETIRKALNLLSQNGYIQKVRGKGSVVLDYDKFTFPVSGIESFTELMDKLQQDSHTYVHEIGFTPTQNKIYRTLSPDNQDAVWYVHRVREITGEKIILDKDYFNEAIIPKLSEKICSQSIYQHIEETLGLKIGFAHKEVTVEEPTEEDKALLDLKGFYNVVVIRSQVYLNDTTLFQYTESRHRPDKFRFVDFARRTK
ncbi:trehalose operon repressor [Oceanobacillus kimchii]|uniref:trehalose operon repressor n=1 Tax=Oceanobacillus kimchii TaxID=746691 RepID=UPI00233115FE|nr:trehalose operon repressor [Oceanobacillus kimchii]